MGTVPNRMQQLENFHRAIRIEYVCNERFVAIHVQLLINSTVMKEENLFLDRI